MIAITKMSLPEAREFYDRELTSHGWLKRHMGRSLKDKQSWLTDLRSQCNLTVSLTKLPDGRTLVRVGDTSNSMWEAAQPKEDDKPPTTGLQAGDFPLLNATKTGKFRSLNKTIEVQLDWTRIADARAL